MGWVFPVYRLLCVATMVVMQMQPCLGCIENERMGLLHIKHFFLSHGINDYAKDELASWVEDKATNCCSWNRVKCNNATGHVTDLSLYYLQYDEKENRVLNLSLFQPFEELVSLNLSWNSYQGWIDNEGFPSLKKLETLDLSSNCLNFSDFSSFTALTSLRTLKLQWNGIEGSLFSEGLPSFNKLETLDLSGNRLNLSVLSSLAALTSLRTLKLDSNDMKGSLSSQDFVLLSKLEILGFSDNALNGSVYGKEFANLKNLKLLDLSNNELSGGTLLYSTGLQNLENLKILDLSGNRFNNSLLLQGLCQLTKLVELDLSYNMLSGQLSKCMSNLTNLQVLDLTNNLFSGSFPSFITNLTSLEYLSLYENHIEGSFSMSTLANHSMLQVLYFPSQSSKFQVETEEDAQWYPTFQLSSLILQRCNLNMNRRSTIPSFLLHQYDLVYIDLSHNNLIGTFPSWLMQNNSRLLGFNLKNNSFAGNFQLSSFKQHIQFLDISANKLNGMLPESIGIILPDITDMNLSRNNFEGGIPSSISLMKELWVLDLSYNYFSGELPKEFPTNCYWMMLLKLSNNFFHGKIVLTSNFASLNMVYLSNNNFSGEIEDVLANNTGLNALEISNNSFSGRIPSSIGRWSSLRILLMAKNQIQGEIPIGISNMTILEILDLSHNRLTGSVPYLTLPSLRFLYFQKNNLSSSIPLSLAKSSHLVTLDLSDNKLTGSIPDGISNLSELRVLLLGGNRLWGHIPIQLCQLKSLNILDLSRNMLSGNIPSCLINLSFGTMRYDDHSDHFQTSDIDITSTSFLGNFYPNASLELAGPGYESMLGDDVLVEVDFRTKSNYYSYEGNILENMTGLDISCNELTGVIPSQIGDLQQIHALNLSHNFLSGSIPTSFSNLTQIESLDLSYNNLSSQIPSQLSQLHFLAIFNVSYNNLSGIPPSTGQFANFDENNYRGNLGLCGPIVNRSCEGTGTSPTSQSNDGAIDMVAFYWSFAASYLTILLALVVVLCINAQWRLAWFHFIGKFIPSCFSQY